MSRHAATSPSVPRSGRRRGARRGHRSAPDRRHRLALASAVVVGLVVSIGGAGTYAFWTDRADITTGDLDSGTMDLRVDDLAVGTDVDYAKTAIAFSGRTPGEFETYNLRFRNVGRPTGTYTLSVLRGATWTYVNDAVTVQAFSGTAVDDATVYPERDTCTGSAIGPAQVFPTATAQALLTAPRTLAGNTEETLCVRIGIATSALNENQNKTGSRLIFRANLTQVT